MKEKENYIAVPLFGPARSIRRNHFHTTPKWIWPQVCEKVEGLMLFFWFLVIWATACVRGTVILTVPLVCRRSKAVVSSFTPSLIAVKNSGGFADNPFCSVAQRRSWSRRLYICMYIYIKATYKGVKWESRTRRGTSSPCIMGYLLHIRRILPLKYIR